MRNKTKTSFILLAFLLVFNNYAQSNTLGEIQNNKSKYIAIPKEYLDKPIQLINRITGYPNKLYHYGSSGMDVDYSVILRFGLTANNQLKIIQEQYQNNVSENDIIKSSVEKNHFNPIVCVVPLSSINENSIVIDSDFFKKNIQLFSPVSNRAMKKYQLQPIESGAIIINDFHINKNNIQISRTLNFIGEKSPEKHYSDYISVEQLLTFRILPEDKMKPRKFDPRVGNFYLSTKRYSSDKYFINEEVFLEKWRLEPKDTAAYFRGELSEPIKPIVFYMDENVPHKWRKYIKQGVLDWLPVFEKIGFKNAIQVYNKPEGAKWDDSDPNYNMIRWVSSEIRDAQGNYVSDPRTGEILNGTLTWYQNYFKSVNNGYFIASAALDPAARNATYSEELYGKNMRETMAHEMGHALGLGHNMIASSSYPTDSLRSRAFVEKHSISPSIMDYAIFNHVAQPEDMPLPLMREIGTYDYWAIEFAYKYVRPSADKSEMEVAFTNNMINERLQNEHLHYMEQEYSGIVDPTNLTGDLGDDQYLTGEYAIKNLKRIMPNIVEWSMPEDGNPAILLSRYDALISQLDVIFKNVIVFVGAEKSRYTYSEHNLDKTYIDRTSETMDFLSTHLFVDMKWLYNSQLEEFSNKNLYRSNLEKLQKNAIIRLLNQKRITRLIDSDIKNNTSNTGTLLRKLSDVILKESKKDNIPLAVQVVYVNKVKELVQKTTDKLILNHLIKNEWGYMVETIKTKSQTEKNPLIKAFYIELSN